MKNRRIKMYVTCVVDIDIPEDCALGASDLVQAAEFRDTWSDGRYPFGCELVHSGAEIIVRNAVHSLLDQYRVYTTSDRNADVGGAAERGRRVWVHVTGDCPLRYRADLEPRTWETEE